MSRLLPLARVLAAVALVGGLAGPAFAAGKPHPTYPERQDVPADAAEREAKCATLRERTGKLGDEMGNPNSVFGRLNIVRVYHRSSERYLEEQCGDVDANGYSLSHRAERSGVVKGSPAAAHHGEEGHHGGAEGAHH